MKRSDPSADEVGAFLVGSMWVWLESVSPTTRDNLKRILGLPEVRS